ncbi:MAG: DNA recombination protein RmuC [Chloroflexota bacterium]
MGVAAGAALLLGVAMGLCLLQLRGLLERVGTMEQHQRLANQGLATLGAGLAQTGTVAHSLVDAAAAIRSELSHAKSDLTELQAYAKARHDLERRTAESIRRLETIIAGTQSKGAAGEHLLELAFAKLPAEWQVRDFRIGNKTVEFGLRLPNNLILPIDSKWPATGLVEEFATCEDPNRQQRLKGLIEAAVLNKAREVRKYIDPGLTVGFGVAAVPDAVYEVCWGTQVEAVRLNVVLVSYSMFVPYLLLVFQTVLKMSQSVDLQQLDAGLRGAEDGIRSVQEELEGRFARALTMLGNSRDEMSVQLSRASRSLTGLVEPHALFPSQVREGGTPDADSAEAGRSTPRDWIAH